MGRDGKKATSLLPMAAALVLTPPPKRKSATDPTEKKGKECLLEVDGAGIRCVERTSIDALAKRRAPLMWW